jgi:16S rRNA (adenine1518-N6/adenine1519-N6)-dimethyltransferase
MDRDPAESGQLSAPDGRQTLSYLRNLFQERGIQPKNKLGQNFLIDLNLLDLILRTAELGSQDVVLEIGCGTGSLTARLCEAAGVVVGVEIDADFVALLRESMAGRSNLTLLHADILKNKNELNGEVLEILRGLSRASVDVTSANVGDSTRRLKVVANLPYVVATPVIANLLLTELSFERMVVTVQWEIAERLTAHPGTKAYGAQAVLVQSLAEVEIVRRLAPTVFWPRPKVESAIVLIRPNRSRRAQLADPLRFRNFLRDLYTHRRKILRGALTALGGKSAKQTVDAKLAAMRLSGEIRAEELTVEQHCRLFDEFGELT